MCIFRKSLSAIKIEKNKGGETEEGRKEGRKSQGREVMKSNCSCHVILCEDLESEASLKMSHLST